MSISAQAEARSLTNYITYSALCGGSSKSENYLKEPKFPEFTVKESHHEAH